jgi:hypothetical protein
MRYNVNSIILDVVGSGEVPELTFTTTALPSEFNVNCSISGEMK